MILFPAIMVGGHLLIAVVDKVPDLNFEPICRQGGGQSLVGKDEVQLCIQDEKAARDALAKQWGGFDSADRMRCIRLSTTNHAASYVEVLTCLELDRDAKKLRRTTNAATDLLEPAPRRTPESSSPPDAGVRVARQPVSAPPPPSPPLPLEPRGASASGFLQIFCVPGLKSILPACNPSGDRP
jgi:hypothetical protein